jgi:aryl-alcohol dehydrogenase-like predicted oxidoreductase
MISGLASKKHTSDFVNERLPKAAVALGATGVTVSQAGFGGYRIQAGIAHHADALEHALRSGINLIDTSANYGDGASETLIGEVLGRLIGDGQLDRRALVVISKVGYLQGQNLNLAAEREQAGRPFKDVVPYGEGISHCIHPDFIEDQLTRSLARLQLTQLDGYLLHNPEYFLDHAHKKGRSVASARREYDARIAAAFEQLEREVTTGRIGFYGVSSNTFPAAADDPEFTSLTRLWEMAASISPRHHFKVVQMPFNLVERGAATVPNQPGGETVLAFARNKNLGVLINRPLNAFDGNHLIRLADLPLVRGRSENEIIASVRAVSRSEGQLWRRILPRLEVPPALVARIKQQIALGDQLKHYWRNFGSFERWRQIEKGNFRPRVQGVVDFLVRTAPDDEDVSDWIETHQALLKSAYADVASHYQESAARTLGHVRQVAAAADAHWAEADTLSQLALRALRSTRGVTSVLVGMRQNDYVADVVAELKRPVVQAHRTESWQRMRVV